MKDTDTKKKKKWRWIVFVCFIVILAGLWEFTLSRFREEDKEFRQQFRRAVKRTFPKQAQDVASSYGLICLESIERTEPAQAPHPPPVVLIHGLDEPGKVWMNLAPALINAGFDVWEMRYPNDQPITDSAWFFYEELTGLRQIGFGRIIIIAHSMGGLVSREMLTDPAVAYFEKVRTEEAPQVEELIMVGTPNHGSELARFRIFTEFRDQWIHLAEGKRLWLRFILDGAGEAKIDLLPGSEFLKTLNSRPHAESVNMSVIAGLASPLKTEEINSFISSLDQMLPENTSKKIGEFQGFLNSVTHSLGDGLVTVDSTRLDGIPHQTVSGNHLTMIRNVSKNSERIPPAVPLIVEQLKKNHLASIQK
ncbi:esterase/lipase family protein [Thermodesulfobacteriota bacterium]